jgi:hypothetical protein
VFTEVAAWKTDPSYHCISSARLLGNVGRLGWFPKRFAEAVSRATPNVVNDWPSTSFWRAPNHDVDE